MSEEQILVVPREVFERVGAFQGFCAEPGAYLEAFFAGHNTFFTPRGPAEENPALKQLIPYLVFRSGDRILHYVRGGSSGEKRLAAKGSVGIGGHINDGDLHIETFDARAYRSAIEREIAEEVRLDGGFTDRVAGLINDETTDVGRVHLGVVHVVDLESPRIEPGEAAITHLEFLSADELHARADRMETWSQIVVSHLDAILEAS